jgi:hypothetical protein
MMLKRKPLRASDRATKAFGEEIRNTPGCQEP